MSHLRLIAATLFLLGSVGSGAAQEDPAPLAYLSHTCSEGMPLQLTFDEVEAVSPRNPEVVTLVAQLWRRDGGAILITPWISTEEHERAGFARRDPRLKWLKEQLASAGISNDDIFVAYEAPFVSLDLMPPPRTIDFRIRLARIGRACFEEDRKRRLEWVGRNCLGPEARASRASCLEQLRRASYN